MEQDLQIEPEADSLTERHPLGEICVGETKSEKRRGPRLCLHRWPRLKLDSPFHISKSSLL